MTEQAKLWAKEHLNGNKWNVWKTVLIVGIITSVIQSVVYSIFGVQPTDTSTQKSAIDIVINIVTAPIAVGAIAYYVNLVRGKAFELEQIFGQFGQFIRIMLTTLLETIAMTIGFMLLIVPGIILMCGFFLTNYILADPDYAGLDAIKVIKLSWEMMNGHKKEYFGMLLLYFVKLLAGIFTLCILWIWTIPEMNLAFAKYATDLIDDYKSTHKEDVVPEEVKAEA